MEEHQQQLSRFLSFSSIFLALVVGGYVLYDRPFQSERPDPSSATRFLESRLWDDPLKVVFSIRSSIEEILLRRGAEGGGAGGVPEATFDYFVEDANEFYDKAIAPGGATNTSVIGVLMPSSRFAVAEETRRRIRYAVLSALNDNFIPQNSENISLLRLDDPVQAQQNTPSSTRPSSIFLSYEVFDTYGDGTSKKRPVVILWIPEDVLGSNLVGSYASMLEQIYQQEPALTLPTQRNYVLIGPTNSNALSNLYAELASESSAGAGEQAGYHPLAEATRRQVTNAIDITDWFFDEPLSDTSRQALAWCLIPAGESQLSKNRYRDCFTQVFSEQAAKLSDPEKIQLSRLISFLPTREYLTFRHEHKDELAANPQLEESFSELVNELNWTIPDEPIDNLDFMFLQCMVDSGFDTGNSNIRNCLAKITGQDEGWLDAFLQEFLPLDDDESEETSAGVSSPGLVLNTSVSPPGEYRAGVQPLVSVIERTVRFQEFLTSTTPLKKRITVISPRATISYGHLDAEIGQRVLDIPDARRQVIRSINHDGHLVNAIREELDRRFVRPLSTVRMALVYESDGKYGRGFYELMRCNSAYFENFDANGASPQTKDSASYPVQKCITENVDSYGYLRGIDGTDVQGGDENAGQSESNTSLSSVLASSSTLEKPFGPHQYDYLRRLADEIQHQQYDVIGVLGTDVFDKLLVLQALKEKNPDALFFTTDLYSFLSDPEQADWTQNLIVASAYGTTVPSVSINQADVCQAQNTSVDSRFRRPNMLTPPFRESYQTAYYYSTCMAITFLGHRIHDLVDEAREHLDGQVYLYEIGRNRAEVLESPEETQLNWFASQEFARNFIYWVMMFSPLIILSLIFALRVRKAWFQRKQNQPVQKQLTRQDMHEVIGTYALSFGLFCLIAHTIGYLLPFLRSLFTWVVTFESDTLETGNPYLLALHLAILPAFIPASLYLRKKLQLKPVMDKLDYPDAANLRSLVICIFMLVLMAVLVLAEYIISGGEPTLVFHGVSHWPATILRLQILAISLCFFHYALARWLTSNERIGQLFDYPDRKGTMCEIWHDHVTDGHRDNRTLRIASRTTLVTVLGIFAYYIFTPQPALIRSSYSVANFFFSDVFLILLAAMAVTLAVISSDATWRGKKLIQNLKGQPLYRYSFDLRKISTPSFTFPEVDNGVFLLKIIAIRTDDLKRLMFAPFLILLLLVASRSTLFEGWVWSIELITLYVCVTAFILGQILMLQHQANQTRRWVLDCIEELKMHEKYWSADQDRVAHTADETGKPANTESVEDKQVRHKSRQLQLERAEHYIRDLNQGAFVAWYRHPIFQALAIPTSGTSGLLLMQQLF